MAEWIDVNERLPEEGVWVLCLFKGNVYEVLRWNEKEYCWEKTIHRAYTNAFVTHWMPLPNPPKVGVNDGL